MSTTMPLSPISAAGASLSQDERLSPPPILAERRPARPGAALAAPARPCLTGHRAAHYDGATLDFESPLVDRAVDAMSGVLAGQPGPREILRRVRRAARADLRPVCHRA